MGGVREGQSGGVMGGGVASLALSLPYLVNGNPVSMGINISEDGNAGLPVLGEDALCGCSVANNGDLVEFYILHQDLKGL